MAACYAGLADDSNLREWTFPEEDRALYTTAPWRGGYRWFRSPNVVCLEQWRRKKRDNPASSHPPQPEKPGRPAGH
jgi:hypothetical protein